MTTSAVCIKVSNLRKIGYSDLRSWINKENNIYTGRAGRIWITTDGEKEIYHYPSSKWKNPFTLKDYELKKSLQLYVIHLFNSGLIYDINELRRKNLGCFCKKQKDGEMPICHAQVLSDLLGKCYKFIKNIIESKQKLLKSI
jgi:hypothetical protein